MLESLAPTNRMSTFNRKPTSISQSEAEQGGPRAGQADSFIGRKAEQVETRLFRTITFCSTQVCNLWLISLQKTNTEKQLLNTPECNALQIYAVNNLEGTPPMND